MIGVVEDDTDQEVEIQDILDLATGLVPETSAGAEVEHLLEGNG